MKTVRSIETIFNSFSSDTAYVLGYFAVDGSMYRNKRGSYYLSFTSSDIQLIELVKNLLKVSNAIEIYQPKHNRKTRYTLQVGSKSVFLKFLEFGFTQNKSLTLKFPNIPDNLLGHFLRGYFDGDGCVSFATYKRKDRKTKLKVFSIRLRCGSKDFVETLNSKLLQTIHVGPGKVYFYSRAYELVYSSKDVIELYSFMYPSDNLPCLGRKKDILKRGIESYGLVV